MSSTLDLTASLIRRPSVTPDDHGCLDVIGERLAALGFVTERLRYPPVDNLLAKHGAGGFLSLAGHPSWSFLLFRDAAPYSQWDIKTLFLQEMFQRGVLAYGTHNMSYAHSDADVQQLPPVYDEVLPLLAELAELENAVIRLARELRKTQRRCNALSKIFIPAHQETITYITGSLEERERESITILKMIRERYGAGRL